MRGRLARTKSRPTTFTSGPRSCALLIQAQTLPPILRVHPRRCAMDGLRRARSRLRRTFFRFVSQRPASTVGRLVRPDGQSASTSASTKRPPMPRRQASGHASGASRTNPRFSSSMPTKVAEACRLIETAEEEPKLDATGARGGPESLSLPSHLQERARHDAQGLCRRRTATNACERRFTRSAYGDRGHL